MRYILKRIVFFFTSLFLIVLAGFLLIQSSASHQEELLNYSEIEQYQQTNLSQLELEKKHWREKFGLNLPIFYIRITHLADIDTLQRIPSLIDRKLIQQLLIRNGNTIAVMQYYHALKEWIYFHTLFLQNLNDSVFSEILKNTHAFSISLLNSWDCTLIEAQLKNIQHNINSYYTNKGLKEIFSQLQSAFKTMKSNAQPWKTWIPSIRLYTNNRFHRWLFGDGKMCKGIVRGDFGYSWYNQRAVLPYLLPKLGWSVLLTFISVCLAYLAAIPLGLLAAQKHNSFIDKFLQTVLMIIFSIPSFLAAILLLRTFSNPDVFNWFPTSGVAPTGGFDSDHGLIYRMLNTIPYIVLPVVAYSYSAVVFLTKLTREQLLQEEKKAYAITAFAKGLPKKMVFQRHLLRNSLLPLITVFSQVFPAAVAGSVVIESIFAIPGMGLETLQAVYQLNYPILAAILVISGIFTITGYFMADVLYVWADPRIRFENKNQKNA
ncbi:MAG: ABC transporter permease [Flavobacteriales bacterium]|nr:ABC transporter permease [Flavobacteriales bacterium]